MWKPLGVNFESPHKCTYTHAHICIYTHANTHAYIYITQICTKNKSKTKNPQKNFLSVGEVLLVELQSGGCLFEVLWNLCLKMNLVVGACSHNPREGKLKTSGFLSLGGQSA